MMSHGLPAEGIVAAFQIRGASAGPLAARKTVYIDGPCCGRRQLRSGTWQTQRDAPAHVCCQGARRSLDLQPCPEPCPAGSGLVWPVAALRFNAFIYTQGWTTPVDSRRLFT